MSDQIEVDRSEFERDGYLVVPEVLSNDEAAIASRIIEERLPSDKQPPGISGNDRNGRKTLITDYCDPQLSNIAGHPRLVAAAEQLTGPLFLIHGTSSPVATYKSPPGAERFSLGYHVDWPHKPPKSGDDRFLNCALHFSTVEPGGGALMVRPGSHRFVEQHLDDPTLGQRMLDQDFNDLSGLAEPLEVCASAGSAVFFHAYLVHDRSENVRDEPRMVLFAHYKGFDNAQQREAEATGAADRFSPKQVRSMDARMKQLCGFDTDAG